MAAAEVRTNLIVNYLHQMTTNEDLMSLFGTVGEVLSVKVIRDRVRGHSLQYGFVNYKRPADAARAIETLNRQRLQNKFIRVSYAQRRCPVVGVLAQKTITPMELEQRFSNLVLDDVDEEAFGQQVDEASRTPTPIVELTPTPSGQHPDQLGVEGAEVEPTSQRLMDEEPVRSFSRKSVYPKTNVTSSGAQWAKHHGPTHQQRTKQHHQGDQLGWPQVATGNNRVQLRRLPRIFVCNLRQDDDEDLLLQMFGNFGVVTDVKVFRDPGTNKCRGLAFVTMATYKQAAEAIARLDGQPLGDNVLKVAFKVQDDKNKQRQTFNRAQSKERAVFKLCDSTIHVTVQNKKRGRYTVDDLDMDGHCGNHQYGRFAKRQRAAGLC